MRTFIKGEKRTNRTRDLRSSRPDGLQLSYGVCFGNVPSNESTLGKAVVHNLTLYRIRKKTPINIFLATPPWVSWEVLPEVQEMLRRRDPMSSRYLGSHCLLSFVRSFVRRHPTSASGTEQEFLCRSVVFNGTEALGMDM